MKFYDTADTGNSLYHYTLFLLGLSSTDTTSFPLADFTRSVNSWLRTAVFSIWKNSPVWEFDDSNYSTLPIATTSTVANQQDYSLPSNALDIERVEIADENGNYIVLRQFDKTELPETALSEFMENAGTPRYYDVIGNSLFLYPKPDIVTTLKLYLERDIYAFVVTDTTKEPGIMPIFHPFMAYGAALDYAMRVNLDPNKATILRNGVALYQQMIEEHTSLKNRDYKTKIRPVDSDNI